jgi:hypothetical protein
MTPAASRCYVSITPLHVDLTAYSAQDVVSGWLDRAGVSGQWLRKKLSGSGVRITTLRGLGYVLECGNERV